MKTKTFLLAGLTALNVNVATYKSVAQCNIAVSQNDTTICKGDTVVLQATGTATAGYALQFDGVNDYVTIGNPYTIGTNNFTIEWWAKLSYQTGYRGMIAGATDHTFFFYASGASGVNKLNVHTSGVWTPGVSGTKNISDNLWHHFAVVRSGSNVLAYVDGVLDISFTNGNSIGATNWEFGRHAPSANPKYFTGQMDEVRIWNYARTQTEIQATMKSKVAPNATGLLAYWQFDEGTGTKANDATANAFHGTVIGATYVSTTAPIVPAFTWKSTSGLNTTGDNIIAKPDTTTTYTVIATSDSCTDSTSVTITVNPSPLATITGNTSVCKGNSTTLTASGGTNYLWNTGDNISTVTVTPTSDSLFSVTVSNSCGTDSILKTVNVLDNPTAPVVTKNGNVLTSNSATGNQWYKDGNPTADTTQTYTATANGNYYVIVTNSDGCSATSSIVSVTGVGINTQHQASGTQFQVFPNPSDGDFELKILNYKLGMKNAEIRIYNIVGEKIYQAEIQNLKSKIQNLKKGVYFLQLVTDEGIWNERIIVN